MILTRSLSFLASSNKLWQWPSMFKSKPSNTHHQCLHAINSMNPSCLTSSQNPPNSSAPARDERSPEPKPRWNPKPEQIKILEAIFNSGMVNPPREEIRRIRDELQEFGQVGEASVFYWFQNRKSRSKHKLRKADANTRSQTLSAVPPSATVPVTTSNLSSSPSSEQSIGSDRIPPPPASLMNICCSPTLSLNQTYFPGPVDFSREPLIFQGPQGCYISSGKLTGTFGSGEPWIGMAPGFLEELMLHHGPATTASVTTSLPPAASKFDGSLNEIEGLEYAVTSNPVGSTVLIDGVPYEVVPIPINVREVFGNDVVLLHSNGQPVLVDESGTTLHPLQHGASYYLVDV